MIINSLNTSEEIEKKIKHLEKLSSIFENSLPNLSHFYSFSSLQANIANPKKKKEKDVWKAPVIKCTKCGIAVKKKRYTNSVLHIMKKRKGLKEIILECQLCENQLLLHSMRRAKFVGTVDYLPKPKASTGLLNQLNFQVDLQPQKRTCEVISKKKKKLEVKNEKQLLTWQLDKLEDVKIDSKMLDQTIMFQKNENNVEKKEAQLEDIIKTFEDETSKIRVENLVLLDLNEEKERPLEAEPQEQKINIISDISPNVPNLSTSNQVNQQDESEKTINEENNILSTLTLFTSNNTSNSFYKIRLNVSETILDSKLLLK